MVLADRLPVSIGTPLATAPRSWSTVAVPSAKTAVRAVAVPEVMGLLPAVKPVMLGAATTVTVTALATVPPGPLTVSV